MVQPPYLKKGDRIGLIAPARKVTPAEMESAIQILRSWGLEVVPAENAYGAFHQYSGTDEGRCADLQRMLDDPSIKAIISARGGYGTIRIIDALDFSAFMKSPKWIIGYSDITVLHSHIHCNFSVETLHATMPVNFSKDQESVETLRKALFGEPLGYEWKPESRGRQGEISAEVVGGNLSLLYALQGSRSDIDPTGKILFLEDLDEYLYHLDRMMVSLKRSGKLKSLGGLLVGGMSDMKDNAVPFGKTPTEIILDAVKEYKYPVAFDFPAGHTIKNLALPLGRRAKLVAGIKNSLYF